MVHYLWTSGSKFYYQFSHSPDNTSASYKNVNKLYSLSTKKCNFKNSSSWTGPYRERIMTETLWLEALWSDKEPNCLSPQGEFSALALRAPFYFQINDDTAAARRRRRRRIFTYAEDADDAANKGSAWFGNRIRATVAGHLLTVWAGSAATS